MDKNQIRFARTLTATWKVLRDPVLTAIYMKKWKRCKDITLTIYGYVFREMYRAAYTTVNCKLCIFNIETESFGCISMIC